MNLYARDCYSYQKEKVEDLNTKIELAVRGYFVRVLQMGSRYLDTDLIDGEENQEQEIPGEILSCLRGYIDTLMDEDYQNELEISQRAFV
jgi:hypothetical protein